jgi:hypothetical protein
MRAALWLLLASAACAPGSRQAPHAVPIVGPQGVPAPHVSCGTDQGGCYQLAGRYCPTGYDIDPTPGPPGNYLVHCRLRAFSANNQYPLAPSPYALQETVQPWPGRDELAPSPYRANPPPSPGYPPLAPGPANPDDRDLGF